MVTLIWQNRCNKLRFKDSYVATDTNEQSQTPIKYASNRNIVILWKKQDSSEENMHNSVVVIQEFVRS